MMQAHLLESEGTRTDRSNPRREGIAVILAVLAAILVSLMPAPEGLSAQGQRAAALFIGVLILWSTEAIPIAVTAILALILQPMLGLGKLPTAFANFMSPAFFFAMAMFIVATAWTTTGLASRFALWMIAKAGTDARRVVYVFCFGTGALSMIVADLSSAAIFMAIALGIFERTGITPGHSRFGKAVMLGIPIAALIGGVATPSGSAINVLGLSMIEQGGGPRIPYLSWMALGLPMVAILLPVAAWVILRFHPPEIESIGDINEIHEARRAMGSISVREWQVIGVMAVMTTLWLLSTWVPVLDITLVAIAGSCAFFLPGMRVLTWPAAQRGIGWEVLIMLGGISSLGALSASSGLAQWIVGSTLSGLADWGPAWVILLISIFTAGIHLVIPSNPVINVVMIPPIMLLAVAAGQNPALYALPVAFTASCAFLLPLESVALVTFTKGYYRMHDMLAPGLLITAVWVVVMTGVLMLIGPMLGLL